MDLVLGSIGYQGVEWVSTKYNRVEFVGFG